VATTVLSICTNCSKINRVPLDTAFAKKPICGNCKAELPLHGAVNEINESVLQKLVAKSPLPIVIDFWASWCGPCKMFAPTFESTARKLGSEIVFAKVDTQANPQAADSFQIRGIPTLIFFQNGVEKKRISGALGLEDFSRWLKSA
jgi:thioredoxin 2